MGPRTPQRETEIQNSRTGNPVDAGNRRIEVFLILTSTSCVKSNQNNRKFRTEAPVLAGIEEMPDVLFQQGLVMTAAKEEMQPRLKIKSRQVDS